MPAKDVKAYVKRNKNDAAVRFGARRCVSCGSGHPSSRVKTDVVIVGIGAAGGILAAELAKAGLKVIGLERGPRLTTQDFNAGTLNPNARMLRAIWRIWRRECTRGFFGSSLRIWPQRLKRWGVDETTDGKDGWLADA
jgi:glycine/D-amino acid oxidase-like deaminating enzyme